MHRLPPPRADWSGALPLLDAPEERERLPLDVAASILTTQKGGETRVPLFGPAGDAALTVGRRPGATVLAGSVGSSVDVEIVLRRN